MFRLKRQSGKKLLIFSIYKTRHEGVQNIYTTALRRKVGKLKKNVPLGEMPGKIIFIRFENKAQVRLRKVIKILNVIFHCAMKIPV
jgi:hypothetical protein